MRGRNRWRTVGAGAVALLGLTAWAVGWDSGSTVPAPMNDLLEEAYAAAAGLNEATEAGLEEATQAGLPSLVSARVALPVAEWDMPVTHNARVQQWIDFLAGRNAERTRLWLEREGRYGGFIRERLRERDMPEDLIYLGMIESGLSPRAYSRAHAAGMWQFIAETGRRYGLEVSTYVDARRDPIQATDAALDYLTDLYERFGSWYLAAAGYNTGENRVERILRQRVNGRKGDDGLFWMIAGHLPRETRDYVPLMLAAGHIAKDPERYGFTDLEYQEPLAYEEVEVPGGTSLTAVARAAGVSADEVRDLNPHLLRGVTPPGRDWSVRVPVGSGLQVAANLEEGSDPEGLALVSHQIRRGETLSHIARRYGVPVSELQAENGGLNPRRLYVGQEIRIPVRSGTVTQAVAQSGTSAQPSWVTYRVRRGDTLWGIARRHGVSVAELRRWNGVGSRIYPGQRLRIEA